MEVVGVGFASIPGDAPRTLSGVLEIAEFMIVVTLTLAHFS
jgi:hypothetical protein